MTLAKELKYALHVIVRPFDGFWDLKHEKRGSLRAAMIILAATVFTFLLSKRYTGFIFNFTYVLNVNFFRETVQVLLMYLLFIVSNWCLTTLMDGKGTFKDIAIATAYALTPYIIINIPLILLSNIMVYDEAAFYYFFLTLAYGWSGMLIVLGTMVTHDYSMSKNLFTIVCIILGMAIMLFLGLLFFSVIQRMIGLVYVLYKEISFRL